MGTKRNEITVELTGYMHPVRVVAECAPARDTSVWIVNGPYGYSGVMLADCTHEDWDSAMEAAADLDLLEHARYEHGPDEDEDEDDDALWFDGSGNAYASDEIMLTPIGPDHPDWGSICVALMAVALGS